jgi:tRNA threonylcarbamoyladenosine biosynthesis protein TsaB
LATFLIIDTALEEAIVALGKDGKIIGELTNKETHSHASFIQVAIANVLEGQQIEMTEIDAIVVTLGPGSYTGLRVGLATAKGMAYALEKPLIGLSTLKVLAAAAIQRSSTKIDASTQIFSMIDAMDDVIALAWVSDDDNTKKRMVFRFGTPEQEIKDKLYEKDLILEFEKKVVYEN